MAASGGPLRFLGPGKYRATVWEDGRHAYRSLVVQGPDTDIDKTTKFWTRMLKDTVSNKLMAEVPCVTARRCPRS